jgi:hypothetical protein
MSLQGEDAKPEMRLSRQRTRQQQKQITNCPAQAGNDWKAKHYSPSKTCILY